MSSNTLQARPIWPAAVISVRHPPLRRQRSYIEPQVISVPSQPRAEMRKTKLLQKQVSVDHVSSLNQQRAWTNSHSPILTESSLKIMNAIKKRPPAHQGKIDLDLGDKSKKALKKDSRINIDIFLGSTTVLEDGLSDSEKHPSSQLHSKQNGDLNRPNHTANRRAQFQASRGTGSVDSKRPPLLRAMSAPIRPLEENSKLVQARRKPRRRRALKEFQESEEDIPNNEAFEDKSKGRKSSNFRPSSAAGCEVETLVSKFVSSSSDSEKEESLPPPIKLEVPKSRPLLKRTGKSVSFQEDDPNLDSTNNGNSLNILCPDSLKDPPIIMRRNSLAPMPTRNRSNRPPTAPAGSLYFKDLQKSFSTEIMLPVKTDTEKSSAVQQSSSSSAKETPSSTKEGNDQNENKDEFPDNVQTPKEKECYRLFKKMTAMGLNVSYDVVLRGLLTPTELRVIQKKRDLELAKQASLEQQSTVEPNQTDAGKKM